MQRTARNSGVPNLIDTNFDVAIVGGGINGAVSAAIYNRKSRLRKTGLSINELIYKMTITHN